ncbi:sigma-70 family RNA polymerase sigma factor [Ureibacillus sp. MALMAid1270]|uniref:sigma-70 family RNA polymerase sigma factor n=1 Tax=Ureibacillus sp. MALMAid1270 TaxID=3411629 RepID=UPI003BA7AB93
MKFVDAVEQYTTYLLKMSYLYVKDRQIAEDTVQEVFVKLYQKYGEELPLENPKGYLVQMTVNRCRDYFRSWHYRKVQVIDLFTTNEKAHNATSESSDVLKHVVNLPLKYREVVILHYFDEQGTAEISTILNIPIGTVKTRLQKARQLLKGILLEEGETGYERQA